MEKEKIEDISMPEKKEKAKEIQRLELDSEQGIDIVIEKISGEPDAIFEYSTARRVKYLPARVVLKQNGKIIEDFRKRAPGLDIQFYSRSEESGAPYNFWCFYSDQKVLMPREWTSNKEGLALVHELGHLLWWFKHPDELKKKEKLLKRRGDLDFQLYTIEERGTVQYREQADEDSEERPATEKDKERLTGQFKKIYQKIILSEAKSERGAWAEGLNLVRKIEQEKGIDLLRPFRGKTPKETRENLEEFIHKTSLVSYEEILRNKIEELELNKELKGIFTKKYKEEAEKTSKEVSEEAAKI